MDLQIKDKGALVLGGGKGLGGAVAAALSSEGARVAVVSRSRPDHDAGFWIKDDLSASGAAERIDEAARRHLGRVDILVLNSGGPPPGHARSTHTNVLVSHFETMFLTLIKIAQLSLPAMGEAGFGRILAIGSSGMAQPIDGLVVSNAVRAALASWLKTLAAEVAPYGITVNTILPGRIATGRLRDLHRLQAERLGANVEDIEARSAADIPLGRFGRAEEFAAMAAFIASPAASYVTGQMIRVDGGLVRAL